VAGYALPVSDAIGRTDTKFKPMSICRAPAVMSPTATSP
jgi:hypothetical protein